MKARSKECLRLQLVIDYMQLSSDSFHQIVLDHIDDIKHFYGEDFYVDLIRDDILSHLMRLYDNQDQNDVMRAMAKNREF